MQEFDETNTIRPWHEKPHNRDREKACIETIARLGQVPQWTLFPAGHHIDAAFYNIDGSVMSFVEHRSRDIKFKQYPDIPLCLTKYSFGLQWSRDFEVPFVILWDLIDGVYAKKVPTGLKAVFFHGNKGDKDRRDPYDQEPCVMIPTKGAVPKIIHNTKEI